MIQVIVADDHRLFRMGIKAAFKHAYSDISIIGEAENGDDLFRILPQTPADLVLLDINMPGLSGAEITRILRSDYPNVKILAISGENSAETVKTMLEAGINGFISKQQGSFDELAEAIRTVMSGLDYFGRDISFIIYDVVKTKTIAKNREITTTFSDREKEIIKLCSKGLLAKEIAARLNISISTVNTYKERIFSKLGINNTMEMVQYALKKGIIRID